jgi:hypothetical protein
MVWPWKMMDSTMDFRIRIASPFCPELKDRPVFSVFLVEEGDELIDGISIGFSRPD